MWWNTEKMVELVSQFTTNKITVRDGEAYHWVDEVQIEFENNFLTLGGFTEDDSIPEDNTSDNEIEYLYLYDRSGDGLGTRDKKIREIYFNIKDTLEDLGWVVVDDPKDFF